MKNQKKSEYCKYHKFYPRKKMEYKAEYVKTNIEFNIIIYICIKIKYFFLKKSNIYLIKKKGINPLQNSIT